MSDAPIDAAVHCQAPPITALLPYLSDYWATYVQETFGGGSRSGTGRLHVTAGTAFTHPAWAQSLALAPEDVSLAAIQQRVLTRARAAVVHCYAGAEAFTHPYLAPELATAANRWLESELLAHDQRLLGTAVLAPQHTESAVEEVHRVAQSGRFVQLALPARSVEPYGAQRYWPIWEAAAEHGLALAIVAGGAALTAPTPVNWPSSFFELYVDAPLQFATHVTSLTFSGIFARVPALRVILVESGWTWLPPLLWRMDWEWKGARREVPWVKDPPSEYVRRHVRATTHPIDAPGNLAELEQVLGQLQSDEFLLYGSDYPRVHAVGVEELLSLLSPEQAERLMWRNAVEVYGVSA